jgi:hypothetical protein
MGRHSAPDDDEELSSADTTVLVVAEAEAEDGRAAGRHHTAGGNGAAEPTTAIVQPARAPEPEETGTHADLRMLRENRALRARCAAAVVVPFLIYTIVLVVVARVDLYLLWMWIPTVTAGVLVGSFLDLEHRRRK